MDRFDLKQFTTPHDLADAAAETWVKTLSLRNQFKPYCVALPGGRIARQFFSEVAQRINARSVPLPGLHCFWGDERCVPPTDPESNFALAYELLFKPLKVPEQQIHRVRGEDPPALAAADAEKELRSVAPTESAGQPVLQLIILGMGEDGHVASLFPEEPEEAIRIEKVYRPVTASKPPPNRITLGYLAIAAAQEVWVLASGAGKEKALRESLSPSGRTPLARVLRIRETTKIFTDIPAEN